MLLMISCSTNTGKAKEHLFNAKVYYNKSEYGKASQEIQIAIRFDSTDNDIRILNAKIKSATNQDYDAIEILKLVLTKGYKVDTVNYLIENCHFSLGNYYDLQKKDEKKKIEAYEKAITYYDLTISKSPQFLDAYIQKQRTLHNLEKYDEALIILNNAISLFQDTMKLIFSRGVEKIYLGDQIGALFDLNNSIKSNKLDSTDMAYAYRFRGDLYFKKDSLDKALIDLSTSINYNPKSFLTYAERAEIYRKKNLKDKACVDYRKAADLGYVEIYKTIKEYCENK